MVFKSVAELEHKSQFFNQKLVKEILKVKTVAFFNVQEIIDALFKYLHCPLVAICGITQHRQ